MAPRTLLAGILFAVWILATARAQIYYKQTDETFGSYDYTFAADVDYNKKENDYVRAQNRTSAHFRPRKLALYDPLLSLVPCPPLRTRSAVRRQSRGPRREQPPRREARYV